MVIQMHHENLFVRCGIVSLSSFVCPGKPTEQLGCVPQVVEWGNPGMLHAGSSGHITENLTVGKDATFLAR